MGHNCFVIKINKKILISDVSIRCDTKSGAACMVVLPPKRQKPQWNPGKPHYKSVWPTPLRCMTDQAQHRALCYDQKPRLVF